MTIRNLDALFKPQSIALVGASNQPNSVGAVLARNLLETGFSGPVFPVNPHEASIRSTLNYKSVADLPQPVDLAVIATPRETVPGLVADLGRRGCRAAVVVTAGFGEGAGDGRVLRAAMLDAAKPNLLRVLGPNCLGFISPERGINASFAHLTPQAGHIAFVSQSGALATAVLDWASTRGFGFSHVISLGDMADIDFGDLLDYLALDTATKSILLYVESITHARKFMSAARIAARAKPVVVIKSGTSTTGARAALSHTGALAGVDLVYEAAFRRAGMLRVHDLRELFEAVTTLSSGLQIGGDRLTIITNGGGAGVLAADEIDERGGRLATLSPGTIKRLDSVLPATWSKANPIDIIGDATGERYVAAIQALQKEKDADALLILNCPTAVASSKEAADAVAAALPRDKARMPAITCWLGDPAAAEARRMFTARGVPTYETPNEAVRAFMQMVEYRRNQEALMETPAAASFPAAVSAQASVRALIDKVVAEGRLLLTEPEAKSVLTAFGVPTVKTEVATTPADARRIASGMGPGAFVLKVLSPDITHKSDVGGVRLDLLGPDAVEEAAQTMLKAMARQAPGARIEGFVVEEMIKRSGARELLLGIGDDAVFGPIVLFGQGGTAAEVIRDRAIGLPPLNLSLARQLIQKTRIARLLEHYRDFAAVDLDAVARVLVALSDLVIAFPEIKELDINPLLADGAGVLALDARIVLRAEDAAKVEFAIRPYPQDLEITTAVRDGSRRRIRPIRPEDEQQLVEMLAKSSPDDIRMRFLGHMKSLPHAMAARLSQIDYDREMALVATPPDSTEIHGAARLIADPDNIAAEFALMVRSDQSGRGIGYSLLEQLLHYARSRELRTVFGEVFTGNAVMRQLLGEFGFSIEAGGGDVLRASLALATGRDFRARTGR
ncbi:bifunctional acetate--CoA ligase family protein/GNAT family N-acetyltransferase [soil metagenome]